MTARSGQRETEISRTLDRVGRRGPLILTPEDREAVAMRLRELKREVIPPLLRVMQSPNPDPRDRENYHRATNELDWLLEIVKHSARVDHISGPAVGVPGPRSRRRRREDRQGSVAGAYRRTSIRARG
jgi:hypothetical protein